MLALEQMSSQGRKNNPSISLSPLLCVHSLVSYIPFSCNHHFNASFLFCIFHPLFPSRLPLFFLISPDLLLFPLNAIPPIHSLCSTDVWKGTEEKREKRVINVFEKKINNHRRLGAGSWP